MIHYCNPRVLRRSRFWCTLASARPSFALTSVNVPRCRACSRRSGEKLVSGRTPFVNPPQCDKMPWIGDADDG